MPNYTHDEAIPLRLTDFSETSQIVALFTRNHGIVPAIAKGAKRQTKKGNTGTISGPLDLLTAGDVVFIPAKAAAELATLAAWELYDHRTPLRTSLPALNAAMLAAEISLALLHPHDPHPHLYDDLNTTLALLPTPQRTRATVSYAKAALTHAGYAPHLDACVSCGTPLGPNTPYFAPTLGGILCNNPNCRTPHPLPLDPRIARALDRLPDPHTLATTPPDRPADPQALHTALLLLLSQIETITDRPLKTRPLLPTIFVKPTP